MLGQDKEVPIRVGIREFRGNLTGLLQQVQDGASFLIVSHGQVVAELRPPPPVGEPRPPLAVARRHRQPGSLRGRIWMAPDFDTFPPDVLDAMEGSDG